MIYRLESRDAHTGDLVVELPYSDLQAEFFINKEDNCRFTLPIQKVDRGDFYPGRHEAWLWEDDQLIFSGPFWGATVTSGDRKLACECQGLLSYFSEREVRSYSKNDYGDNHAWAFVRDCQTGYKMDLRITRGTFGNGMAKTSYSVQPWSPKKVLDALGDLATVTGAAQQGFDFDIDTASRKFNTWYPRRGTDRQMKLAWPKEIRSYSDQIIARSMVNDLRMLGSGSGSKQYYSTITDPVSAEAFWGMQNTMSYSGMKTRADLDAKGKYNISILRTPKIQPSIELDMESIEFNPYQSIGDIFDIEIDDGWVQYHQKMRHAGGQLTVRATGQGSFSMYLNDTREVVDA